jgi:multiple sugar transport system permease protein
MAIKTETIEDLKRRFGSDRIRERYDWLGIGFVMPVVLTFIFVTVIPVLYGLWLSLQTGRGAANLEFVALENYISLWQSSEFRASIAVGVTYAIYTVFFQVILGTVIALALHKIKTFASTIRAIIFVPYMIPTVAFAVVVKMLLNPQIGLVNWALRQLGIVQSIDQINWLSQGFALHTVTWASVWRWSIFVVILVLARLHSIDETLYEMAKVNGASTYRQFVDITYPNIKSVLFLVILLRSIWMFNKFDMIWLLSKGGPLGETTTMVILAYKEGFQQFALGTAAAITTVMFIMLIIFGIVYFMLFSPEDEVEVAHG